MIPVTIAAVIPTHDREALIGRCLEAVLSQRRPPDEVIVVDDGSTDATLDVLRSFGDAIVVVSQDNAGASAARNAGVARASSGWIAFCDSDDLWTAEHLQRLDAAVHATDACAALYFDDTAIAASDGGGTFFGVAGLSDADLHVANAPVPWIWSRLQPMLLQSSLIRRQSYEDVGGLSVDLRTRHDTHLFYRLGFRYPMCAVPGVGVHLCDDADDAGRLTGHHGQRSQGFWAESLRMHDELAAIAPDADSARRLRKRASGDRIRLAGHDLRAGHRPSAARHLWRAATTSPGTVVDLAGRALRRRVVRRPADTSRIPR